MKYAKIVALTLTLCSTALAENVNLTVSGLNTIAKQWFDQSVIPAVNKVLAPQGKTLSVTYQNTASSAEATKQQYALDLKAGRGADILSFDGFWLPEFVAAGLIKPLDVVVGKEALQWDGWKQIPSGLQGILGYQGKLYGVGQGTDVRGIYYRSDLFKQAGLPVPWTPRSWNDVLSAARALKKALPDVTPLQINAGTAMGEATTMQGYDMLLLGTGTQMYDPAQQKWVVKSPGILDTLNFYKTVYLDDKLGDARWQLIPNGRDLSFKAFADGKLGILLEGDYLWRSVLNPLDPSGLKNRDQVVAFTRMPAEAPGKGIRKQNYVTISGGTGYLINPNSKHPQEAWTLLSTMSSKDMLDAYQKLEPRIRIRKDVAIPGDKVMQNMATTLLPVTVTRPMLPAYNKVSEQAQLMTERVVSGQMTPQQAMDAYAAAVKQIVGADKTAELK
ncbi:extracellular solute-binding protein (plasmid) [Deinococcus metallilatus]|uniref:Extracellular solute-binding protein n=1 Tax=Deinococcus metallilatus TaxID=1211322 RepID=A0AAJ5JZX8_9DEIO|nr:extracellular solute-binding protein [Deinococcus metallilatus]MBB5295681.1 multiple sugar transport system substrate-binding protein [Deinococcus metallilatus]QBY06865.1 extracellular solute-binding protein [Deinococcus metallilatus]TLK32254.1 extracellular solute-binding protein [Deinococcus metallilatus]GMA14210.1 ABC transporter substrate-binding protein [Deinococcus metallilatus]